MFDGNKTPRLNKYLAVFAGEFRVGVNAGKNVPGQSLLFALAYTCRIEHLPTVVGVDNNDFVLC